MSIFFAMIVLTASFFACDPPALDKPAPKELEPKIKANAPTLPAERTDDGFKRRHASFNARAKQGAAKGDIGLIFLGDSITEGWEGAGKAAWNEHFAKHNAVNLGIGGDQTQNVLWRLANGNVEGLAKPKEGSAPKLIVLMIGTNNSNGTDNTAEEIAAGITAIVNDLRTRLPETRILLLDIFPRGELPNVQREKNVQASTIAAKIADDQMIHHLDIGPSFLEKDGTITKAIMPDALHLSAEGYARWAKAIEPKVKELMTK